MIHSIKGKIVERIEGGLIILENHDIGFEIWADKELYDTGDVEVKAFVIFQPSESEWRMYGFFKEREESLFSAVDDGQRARCEDGDENPLRRLRSRDRPEYLGKRSDLSQHAAERWEKDRGAHRVGVEI